MANTDLTQQQQAHSDWRLLGQSELNIDVLSRQSLLSWLLPILTSINLPENLIEKIKLSLDEAIAHFSSGLRIEVRILISADVQADQPLNKNWGYFKLEKVGISTEREDVAEHIVEYYLYPEK